MRVWIDLGTLMSMNFDSSPVVGFEIDVHTMQQYSVALCALDEL